MSDDAFDSLGDLFSDPNGPAYETSENRTGPPLEYVAEKLRNSIERLHALNRELSAAAAEGDSAEADGLGQAARVSSLTPGVEASFHYAMVAYLALNNMLALANPPSFSDRLLGMRRKEFGAWLDDIDRGGSVT